MIQISVSLLALHSFFSVIITDSPVNRSEREVDMSHPCTLLEELILEIFCHNRIEIFKMDCFMVLKKVGKSSSFSCSSLRFRPPINASLTMNQLFPHQNCLFSTTTLLQQDFIHFVTRCIFSLADR